MWLGSSVVRVLARLREVLGSSPGRATCFFLSCDIWWPVWVRARAASSKGTVSSVPARFRANSSLIKQMNLIKQGEIVAGRPCGSAAQWSECLHGMREVLGSSPGRAMCFFLPFDISQATRKWRTGKRNTLHSNMKG